MYSARRVWHREPVRPPGRPPARLAVRRRTTLIVKADPVTNSGGGTTSARCPACRQLGTFEVIGQDLRVNAQNPSVNVGHRRCPNTSCRTHLFVVLQNSEMLVSYPPVRIDFDATNIPASVVTALEEAITCHA